MQGQMLGDTEFLVNGGKPTTRAFSSKNQEGDKQVNYAEAGTTEALFSSKYEGNWAPDSELDINGAFEEFGSAVTQYEGFILPDEVDTWDWMDPQEEVAETVTKDEAKKMARRRANRTFWLTFWITGLIALVLGAVIMHLAMTFGKKSNEDTVADQAEDAAEKAKRDAAMAAIKAKATEMVSPDNQAWKWSLFTQKLQCILQKKHKTQNFSKLRLYLFWHW